MLQHQRKRNFSVGLLLYCDKVSCITLPINVAIHFSVFEVNQGSERPRPLCRIRIPKYAYNLSTLFYDLRASDVASWSFTGFVSKCSLQPRYPRCRHQHREGFAGKAAVHNELFLPGDQVHQPDFSGFPPSRRLAIGAAGKENLMRVHKVSSPSSSFFFFCMNSNEYTWSLCMASSSCA